MSGNSSRTRVARIPRTALDKFRVTICGIQTDANIQLTIIAECRICWQQWRGRTAKYIETSINTHQCTYQQLGAIKP